jgi:hypothetical protein
MHGSRFPVNKSFPFSSDSSQINYPLSPAELKLLAKAFPVKNLKPIRRSRRLLVRPAFQLNRGYQ